MHVWLARAVAALVFFLIADCRSQSYCDLIDPPVPPCLEPVPRDLLFMVDASNSMDRDRFYGEMLEYTLALYCSFDPSLGNQAGMIIFAREIKVVIPLGLYSRDDWKEKVDAVKLDSTACCSCCTPTAEAFLYAKDEFLARGKNNIKIGFMITDGVPSNNNAAENGIPSVDPINGKQEWWFTNPSAGWSPALYNYRSVPNSALELKNSGVRLMLVGVPSNDGSPPDQSYFNGGYANGKQLCLRRANTNFCASYNSPPFPIVSSPAASNSFSTTTWNVQQLITLTVKALCIVPTYRPSQVPTKSPTFRPTKSPSRTPSRSPTKRPTSKAPTRSPSRSPTKRPTSKSPTKSPTKRPTSQKPTLFPTFAPSKSPTSLSMDQLDVTFLLDRSESMRWHDEHCKAIIAKRSPLSGTPAKFACWELFMTYLAEQVKLLVAMPSGISKNRPLGWHNDYPPSREPPAKGLRVNVIGFACGNDQKTPKVFRYTQQKYGGPITSEAMLMEFISELRQNNPDGGTCPGLAIEETVKQIEETSPDNFPLQTVILITDGVFYDGSHPERATQGLRAYKALRFAVGIAVAKGKHTYGLDPVERLVQKQQLSKFVAPNTGFFKDLGAQGWELLQSVASGIANDLTRYYFLEQPIARYTWCGFRRLFNCASDMWRSRHCEWGDNKANEWACQPRQGRRANNL